jgi:hypothetical protein
MIIYEYFNPILFYPSLLSREISTKSRAHPQGGKVVLKSYHTAAPPPNTSVRRRSWWKLPRRARRPVEFWFAWIPTLGGTFRSVSCDRPDIRFLMLRPRQWVSFFSLFLSLSHYFRMRGFWDRIRFSIGFSCAHVYCQQCSRIVLRAHSRWGGGVDNDENVVVLRIQVDWKTC